MGARADTLEIRLVPSGPEDLGGKWMAVHLMVNGEELDELVHTYEDALGYLVGGYKAIAVNSPQEAIESLEGKPNGWPGEGRQLFLVDDACGVPGCFPVFGRIRLGSKVVEWFDFSNPFRPDHDYSGLRFRFDRAQYEAAVRRTLGVAAETG
jgi:hypothetical protein